MASSTKVLLAITMLVMFVAAAAAAAAGVDTGKNWKSSYKHMSRKRRSLSQVDRIVLQVINEMTREQAALRSAVQRALTSRNRADSNRRRQLSLVNRLRAQRVNLEGQYNAKRAQEQRALNELKVREKLHRAKMSIYQKTHRTNTVEISRLDREKRILTEIRRLLGTNRSSRFTHHRDQADIHKARAHKFNSYKDKRSRYHHGAQRFHGHWTELSYVSTGTQKLLGVNLKGITSSVKQVKFVNQGTVLDWHKQNTKTWTSFGFDLSKIVFRVMDKATKKVSYVALQTPYHKCGLDKLAETNENFSIKPELLKSKSGAVATCYRGNSKVNNCWNQIVLDTTKYQPLGILEVESLGKCWTADNALRFKFRVYGLF